MSSFATQTAIDALWPRRTRYLVRIDQAIEAVVRLARLGTEPVRHQYPIAVAVVTVGDRLAADRQRIGTLDRRTGMVLHLGQLTERVG